MQAISRRLLQRPLAGGASIYSSCSLRSLYGVSDHLNGTDNRRYSSSLATKGVGHLARKDTGGRTSVSFADVQNKTLVEQMKEEMLHMDINSMVGSSMPLGNMRIGAIIHNIEMNPGQGAKLVRAAGTNAKILKEPASGKCLIKLPSGDTRWINARCRATIGQVSNPSHGVKKLRKAGQSRWLGIRPKVRGVAMNPCDHPHGGGEGKSKSSGSRGRTSVSPWGKPCKGGYKSASVKKKKKRLAAREAKM